MEAEIKNKLNTKIKSLQNYKQQQSIEELEVLCLSKSTTDTHERNKSHQL